MFGESGHCRGKAAEETLGELFNALSLPTLIAFNEWLLRQVYAEFDHLRSREMVLKWCQEGGHARHHAVGSDKLIDAPEEPNGRGEC